MLLEYCRVILVRVKRRKRIKAWRKREGEEIGISENPKERSLKTSVSGLEGKHVEMTCDSPFAVEEPLARSQSPECKEFQSLQSDCARVFNLTVTEETPL